jgi:succinate-semialdehyde dehydrogenase/glutarate-semialdehyde dehydrogenase
MSESSAVEVVDPSTEEVFATVPDAGAAGAAEAVDAAAAAFPVWATTPPRTRSEVLRRAYEVMIERADALAETIVRENGKPLTEARGEVVYAAEFFRWFSEEAVRMHGSVVEAPGGGGRQVVINQPVGVSYLITPWNFPAAMLTRKVGPALAAGCTVVAKPASLTPLTAMAVCDIVTEALERAGAPEGVVNLVVSADSKGVTSTMLGDERVRKLSFTGSTEVGRALLAQAAERVVNCSMELGGNAPFIVFADADVDAAVEGAMVAKLRHNGETCTAANRFFVEAPVADEFARKLAAAMAGLTVGPGLDPTTRIGPLVDAATREKVERLVEAGVDGGARVLTGGRRPSDRPKGFFYEPTVVADVAPDSALLAEEVFGPVASITTFDPGDDVVAQANAVEHGLVAYLYTGDIGRGMALAERLEAGMVAVNKGIVSDPAAPFGGVKQSGLGREGGHEGLLAYVEPKYIAVDWSG